MNEVVGRLCAGSAAGFAACGPMTVLMEGFGRLLPAEEQEPLPPRQITERAAEKAGAAHRMTEDERAAATMANHFAYAVTTGAAYGALAPHVALPPVARGVAFALSLWREVTSAGSRPRGCTGRRPATPPGATRS